MYEGVRLLQARLQTTVTHLGATSVGLWVAMGRVQQTEQLVSSLTDKLDALQQVYGLRTAAVASRRARRLNQTVIVFTAVSVVASLAAVIDFAFNDRLRGPDILRSIVVLVVSLSCAAVVMVATQERRPGA